MGEANSPTVHSSLTEPISELNNDLDKFQQMIEATVDMDAIDRGILILFLLIYNFLLHLHIKEK